MTLGGVFLYSYQHSDGKWTGTHIDPGGWVVSWALSLTSERLAFDHPGGRKLWAEKLFAQGDHPAAPGAWLRGSLAPARWSWGDG